MAVEFRKDKDKMIVSLTGRLDSSNAQSIHEEIKKELSGFDGDIIFNLENLEYMTSAGLQVLLLVSKNRKHKGKMAYVYKPQQIVDYVLEVSGFYSFIKKLDRLPNPIT